MDERVYITLSHLISLRTGGKVGSEKGKGRMGVRVTAKTSGLTSIQIPLWSLTQLLYHLIPRSEHSVQDVKEVKLNLQNKIYYWREEQCTMWADKLWVGSRQHDNVSLVHCCPTVLFNKDTVMYSWGVGRWRDASNTYSVLCSRLICLIISC